MVLLMVDECNNGISCEIAENISRTTHRDEVIIEQLGRLHKQFQTLEKSENEPQWFRNYMKEFKMKFSDSLNQSITKALDKLLEVNLLHHKLVKNAFAMKNQVKKLETQLAEVVASNNSIRPRAQKRNLSSLSFLNETHDPPKKFFKHSVIPEYIHFQNRDRIDENIEEDSEDENDESENLVEELLNVSDSSNFDDEETESCIERMEEDEELTEDASDDEDKVQHDREVVIKIIDILDNLSKDSNYFPTLIRDDPRQLRILTEEAVTTVVNVFFKRTKELTPEKKICATQFLSSIADFQKEKSIIRDSILSRCEEDFPEETFHQIVSIGYLYEDGLIPVSFVHKCIQHFLRNKTETGVKYFCEVLRIFAPYSEIWETTDYFRELEEIALEKKLDEKVISKINQVLFEKWFSLDVTQEDADS